jgi:hypothetical protein
MKIVEITAMKDSLDNSNGIQYYGGNDPKKMGGRIQKGWNKLGNGKNPKPLNQKLVDKYSADPSAVPFAKRNSQEYKEAVKKHGEALNQYSRDSINARAKVAEKDLYQKGGKGFNLKQSKEDAAFAKSMGRVSGMKHPWELNKKELDSTYKAIKDPSKEVTAAYNRLRKNA